MLASAEGTLALGDVIALLGPLGFHLERESGSHRIYRHPGVPRPFALQPKDGKVRPYQVRQLLGILDEFDLPGMSGSVERGAP